MIVGMTVGIVGIVGIVGMTVAGAEAIVTMMATETMEGVTIEHDD
jgi:hypothetical protein